MHQGQEERKEIRENEEKKDCQETEENKVSKVNKDIWALLEMSVKKVSLENPEDQENPVSQDYQENLEDPVILVCREK